MRSALSSSNKANLPRKDPNAAAAAKKKRKKHDLSEEEIEDKIEEFRLFLNKHRTERQNKLAQLEKERKRALAAIEEDFRKRRIQIDCDINPKINDDLKCLNESVIALEDLDDTDEDDEDVAAKPKGDKAKEVFCRICFERDTLRSCGECGVKCCEACWTECDRDGCDASFCESCKEALKTVHCGFCDFCKSCRVQFGGKNHAQFCLK